MGDFDCDCEIRTDLDEERLLGRGNGTRRLETATLNNKKGGSRKK